MKKVLFAVCALIALSLSFSNICFASGEVNEPNSVVEATGDIAVWKITGTGNVQVKVAGGGSYNSETNRITIEGTSYVVEANPNYKQGRSNKSKYEYYANKIYYFNL